MNFPISGSPARMGRPPMNVKPIFVRLGVDIPKRIDAVLEPKEKRADLIRDAVERELKRREGKQPGRAPTKRKRS
jgi:metal-responsive CopG/Arc/MetJ family transcriptional regulator